MSERHEKDGGWGDIGEVGKFWCGGVWYVAKEEVEVRKLEKPIVCQQFPRPELEEREECQGTIVGNCLIRKKSTRKRSKFLPLIRLHGNGSILLDFTRSHSGRFSLGMHDMPWMERKTNL